MSHKLDAVKCVSDFSHISGSFRQEFDLSKVTWFKVGGPAEYYFKPKDISELQQFLQNKPQQIAITPLGIASNVIISDKGIKGVVIRLGRAFNYIKESNIDILEVGAATLDRNVALYAEEIALEGLEFLSGIPGTIGGALYMNAGAYGYEMKDIVKEVTLIDFHGYIHTLPASEFKFSYRSLQTPFDDIGYIFLGAKIMGKTGNPKNIRKKIEAIQKARATTQPITEKTGGSTFKNPIGSELKAWQLIDMAGCRGMMIGGAKVSELHCNFLINEHEATAQDIVMLGEEIRKKVFEKFGIELIWEIKKLG